MGVVAGAGARWGRSLQNPPTPVLFPLPLHLSQHMCQTQWWCQGVDLVPAAIGLHVQDPPLTAGGRARGVHGVQGLAVGPPRPPRPPQQKGFALPRNS